MQLYWFANVRNLLSIFHVYYNNSNNIDIQCFPDRFQTTLRTVTWRSSIFLL